MDEKYPRITPTSTFTSTSLAGWNTPDIQRSMLDRRDRRKRQWLLLFVSAVLASLLLWRSYSRLRLRLSALRQPETISIIDSNSKAVPLEAHIMSKCPDSKDCLHDLVLPAMQRIYDKVDFKLSYIGTASDTDDSVECKHGPSECLGDMIELCAADLYPDPKIYLGFTMCLTREYAAIPDRSLIEDCALEHGIDFKTLNGCVSPDDGHAVALLRDSVQRSNEAGVRTSCTIRLNNQVRCVRDGGAWKSCEGGYHVDDLVNDIEELYEKL